MAAAMCTYLAKSAYDGAVASAQSAYTNYKEMRGTVANALGHMSASTEKVEKLNCKIVEDLSTVLKGASKYVELPGALGDRFEELLLDTRPAFGSREPRHALSEQLTSKVALQREARALAKMWATGIDIAAPAVVTLGVSSTASLACAGAQAGVCALGGTTLASAVETVGMASGALGVGLTMLGDEKKLGGAGLLTIFREGLELNSRKLLTKAVCERFDALCEADGVTEGDFYNLLYLIFQERGDIPELGDAPTLKTFLEVSFAQNVVLALGEGVNKSASTPEELMHDFLVVLGNRKALSQFKKSASTFADEMMKSSMLQRALAFGSSARGITPELRGELTDVFNALETHSIADVRAMLQGVGLRLAECIQKRAAHVEGEVASIQAEISASAPRADEAATIANLEKLPRIMRLASQLQNEKLQLLLDAAVQDRVAVTTHFECDFANMVLALAKSKAAEHVEFLSEINALGRGLPSEQVAEHTREINERLSTVTQLARACTEAAKAVGAGEVSRTLSDASHLLTSPFMNAKNQLRAKEESSFSRGWRGLRGAGASAVSRVGSLYTSAGAVVGAAQTVAGGALESARATADTAAASARAAAGRAQETAASLAMQARDTTTSLFGSAAGAASAAAGVVGDGTNEMLQRFLGFFDNAASSAASASSAGPSLESLIRQIHGNAALQEEIRGHASLQQRHGAVGQGPAGLFLKLVHEVVSSGDFTESNPRVKSLKRRLSGLLDLLGS